MDHQDLNFQTTSIKQEDTLSEAVSPSSSSTSESPFPPNQEMECYIISNDGYKSRWKEYINADIVVSNVKGKAHFGSQNCSLNYY